MSLAPNPSSPKAAWLTGFLQNLGPSEQESDPNRIPEIVLPGDRR